MLTYKNRVSAAATVVLLALYACGFVMAASAAEQGPKAGQEAQSTQSLAWGAEVNPTGSPIGGGDGYQDIATSGDYIVTNAAELVAALSKASSGDVVYVSPDASINLTGKSSLSIGSGVTLAGNRGYKGSNGPLLYSDELNTNGLFSMVGAGARITGLRIQGPDGEIGPSAYYQPNSTAISVSGNHVQIDNNEIYNWSYGGVSIVNGAQNAHVHHNYIHHVRRNGLGYPVVVNKGNALIEANIFDYYRHAIAGTGYIGSGYEARYNLVLPNATSHAFDMHGGADYCPKRGSGNPCSEVEQYMAGEYVSIHHNTFMVTSQPAIVLRGVPREKTEAYNNWFFNPSIDQSFSFKHYNGGNTSVYNNVYGPDKRISKAIIEPEIFVRKGNIYGTGQIVAMTGRFKDAEFQVLSPADASVVKGVVPLAVELDTAGAFKIKHVEFLIDDELVYSGAVLPKPGEVVVDTIRLQEAVHRFTVSITIDDGTVVPFVSSFRTNNFWSIIDEMKKPVVDSWFGDLFSAYTSNDAAGWDYATGDPDSFMGDDNRKVRISAGAEPLVWQAPMLHEFAITLYMRQATPERLVAISVTTGDSNWVALPYTARPLGGLSPDGWQAFELVGKAPAGLASSEFRFEVAPDTPAGILQLGRVDLTCLEI